MKKIVLFESGFWFMCHFQVVVYIPRSIIWRNAFHFQFNFSLFYFFTITIYVTPFLPLQSSLHIKNVLNLFVFLVLVELLYVAQKFLNIPLLFSVQCIHKHKGGGGGWKKERKKSIEVLEIHSFFLLLVLIFLGLGYLTFIVLSR